MMTTPNNDYDANGYYIDGNGTHLETPHLTIFRSQYNIGRKLVETARNGNVLDLTDNQQPDGKKKFEKINMLFLGPTYTNLRNQTRKDLANFLHERTKFSPEDIQSICQSRVLNSSSISSNYEEMHFIKGLRNTHLNDLHLLVLDEAHWGIASGSIIENFFQHLWKVLNDITQAKQPRPSLIILLVSATIDVLTRVINNDASYAFHVDWYKLRHEDVNKFGTSDYQDIFKLKLCNDNNPNLLQKGTMIERSLLVAEEYYNTIKMCLNCVFKSANGDWKSSATWKALKFLFRGTSNEEIAEKACAHDYALEDNCMILLRLQLNDHITQLYNAIIETFKAFNDSDKTIQPFEVIQLIQDSDSILNQLSSKAKRHLHLDEQVAENDLDVSKLINLPCLILVNDRLAMGERLPPTCKAYDIRSRYKGTADDMKGFASTFIQDIGRCCGHKKPEALVLMSIADDNDRAGNATRQFTMADIQFRQLHRLLTKSQTMAADHPERNAQVFTKLLGFIIVLDAEPQIGKTGAIMSMLDILYSEHTSLSKRLWDHRITTTSQLIIARPTKLQQMTEKLCSIVNDSNETLDVRIEKLKTNLSENNTFQRYHDMINNFKEAQELLDAIYDYNLIKSMNSARRIEQKTFYVADCGCGLHGIVHVFRANSLDLDLNVHIIGIDLHESIRDLEKSEPDSKVTFMGNVADMGSTDGAIIENGSFNVILYSLSLFENDITRHIHWANRHLKTGGTLIIADLIRRFPKNFETSVNKCGFKSPKHYEKCGCFRVWSFEKESNNIDELQTVQLYSY